MSAGSVGEGSLRWRPRRVCLLRWVEQRGEARDTQRPGPALARKHCKAWSQAAVLGICRYEGHMIGSTSPKVRHAQSGNVKPLLPIFLTGAFAMCVRGVPVAPPLSQRLRPACRPDWLLGRQWGCVPGVSAFFYLAKKNSEMAENSSKDKHLVRGAEEAVRRPHAAALSRLRRHTTGCWQLTVSSGK